MPVQEFGEYKPQIRLHKPRVATNRGLLVDSDVEVGDVVYSLAGLTEVVSVDEPETVKASRLTWWPHWHKKIGIYPADSLLITENNLKGVPVKDLEPDAILPFTGILPEMADAGEFPYDPFTFGAWFSQGPWLQPYLPMHPETREWFDQHGHEIPNSILYGPTHIKIDFIRGCCQYGLALEQKFRGGRNFYGFGWHTRWPHPALKEDERVEQFAFLMRSLGAKTKLYWNNPQNDFWTIVVADWIQNFWTGQTATPVKTFEQYYKLRVDNVKDSVDPISWTEIKTASGTILRGWEAIPFVC